MKKFEEELYDAVQNIVQWHRYVDDCILSPIHDLLNHMNNRYPLIEFALKVGGDSINFLYITVGIRDESFEFATYRKPTSTDIHIHGESFCLWPHKLAAFNNMTHRLTHVAPDAYPGGERGINPPSRNF